MTAVVFYDENRDGLLQEDETARVPEVELEVAGRTARSEKRTGRAVIEGVSRGTHPVLVRAAPPFYFLVANVSAEAPQASGAVVNVPLALPIGRNNPHLYMASGDSISQGFGSSDGMGYRSWLQEKLRDHFGRGEVIYRGPGGGSSDGGAARIATDLRRARPAYTLILWGTNDWHAPRCHPPEACFTVPSLRTMIREAREFESLPCLATIPPVNAGFNDTVPPSRNEWIAQMNGLIRSLAREERALLVDVHAAFQARGNLPSLFADHVHPNDTGYELMATAFLEALSRPGGLTSSSSEEVLPPLLGPFRPARPGHPGSRGPMRERGDVR